MRAAKLLVKFVYSSSSAPTAAVRSPVSGQFGGRGRTARQDRRIGVRSAGPSFSSGKAGIIGRQRAHEVTAPEPDGIGEPPLWSFSARPLDEVVEVEAGQLQPPSSPETCRFARSRNRPEPACLSARALGRSSLEGAIRCVRTALSRRSRSLSDPARRRLRCASATGSQVRVLAPRTATRGERSRRPGALPFRLQPIPRRARPPRPLRTAKLGFQAGRISASASTSAVTLRHLGRQEGVAVAVQFAGPRGSGGRCSRFGRSSALCRRQDSAPDGTRRAAMVASRLRPAGGAAHPPPWPTAVERPIVRSTGGRSGGDSSASFLLRPVAGPWPRRPGVRRHALARRGRQAPYRGSRRLRRPALRRFHRFPRSCAVQLILGVRRRRLGRGQRRLQRRDRDRPARRSAASVGLNAS